MPHPDEIPQVLIRAQGSVRTSLSVSVEKYLVAKIDAVVAFLNENTADRVTRSAVINELLREALTKVDY